MDSIERAMQRTILASRALDAAADDVRAFGKQGGVLGAAAVDALQGQAAQAEALAAELERLATT